MYNVPPKSATDQYDPNAGIWLGPFDDADTAVVVVSGAPAAMQFYGPADLVAHGAWTEGQEYVAPAGAQTINSIKIGNIRGIRLRNQLAGQTATVSVALSRTGQKWDTSDPIIELGSLYAGTLGVSGSVVSATTVIPRETTLPAGPADGQQCMLDLGANWPGVEWLCTYKQATGYWDVIGAALAQSDTSAANRALTANGVWQNVPGIGQFALPNIGVYVARLGAGYLQTKVSGDYLLMGVSVGGAGPAPPTVQLSYPTGNDAIPGGAVEVPVTANATGTIVALQGQTNDYLNTSITGAWLSVTPVRIK